MDLNDCNVVWSHTDPDGGKSAGDGSAADDATYNFILRLVFPILSAVCAIDES